jgi:hypothetical protein
MVSQPVCLGTKHPFGAYNQILIIVWQLQLCWFGTPSLTRRVCRLQLLLAFASAVIFGFESRRTRGHVLLSQIRDFPFRRLLWLAGSRWRYSTPPPHGSSTPFRSSQAYISISALDILTGFPHSPGPQLLPSTSFRVYYSPFILPFDCSLTYWQHH